MTRLFKKLDITGVAVMLLAFFVAVGFTSAEMNQQQTWYEVEIIDENEDHDDPENQEILGLYPGGQPISPCNQLSGEICAIQLTFDEEETDMPATVADAIDDDDVSVGQSRHFSSN